MQSEKLVLIITNVRKSNILAGVSKGSAHDQQSALGKRSKAIILLF